MIDLHGSRVAPQPSRKARRSTHPLAGSIGVGIFLVAWAFLVLLVCGGFTQGGG